MKPAADPDSIWIITVRLPRGLPNPGRFVARLLKHIGRVWGVRCVAIGESSEIRRMQALVESLAARCARQSELLSQRAEKVPIVRSEAPD